MSITPVYLESQKLDYHYYAGLPEYERLKKEIDILIANTNNRTRLAAEVSTLEDEIRWKSENLKDLVRDIERAKEHYNTLLAFLRTVGVDGRQSRFTLDVIPLLQKYATIGLKPVRMIV